MLIMEKSRFQRVDITIGGDMVHGDKVGVMKGMNDDSDCSRTSGIGSR